MQEVYGSVIGLVQSGAKCASRTSTDVRTKTAGGNETLN